MKKYSKPLVVIENYYLSEMIAGCAIIEDGAFSGFIDENEVSATLQSWATAIGGEFEEYIANIYSGCYHTALANAAWSQTFYS